MVSRRLEEPEPESESEEESEEGNPNNTYKKEKFRKKNNYSPRTPKDGHALPARPPATS
jgi:hypothetical protein